MKQFTGEDVFGWLLLTVFSCLTSVIVVASIWAIRTMWRMM